MGVLRLIRGRSALALATVAAIGVLPLLPPAHVHRGGIEGRAAPVAHAHPTAGGGVAPAHGDEGVPAAAVAGHGDHSLAVFLQHDYTERQPGGLVAVPAARVTTALPPDDARVHPAAGGDHPTHDPPRAASITRGPPSRS